MLDDLSTPRSYENLARCFLFFLFKKKRLKFTFFPLDWMQIGFWTGSLLKNNARDGIDLMTYEYL